MKDLEIIAELLPVNSPQKSFYRKAAIVSTLTHELLKSYDTMVCGIDFTHAEPVFLRFWDGWSVTTARHTNEFRRQYGFPPIAKREWLQMPLADPREHYGSGW